MGRRAKDDIPLTFQRGKGYKKMVGWTVGADGERRPRIWWLGHNVLGAKDAAERVIEVFGEPGAAQDGVWTEQGLKAAKQEVDLVKRCWTDIAALATRVLDVPRPTRVTIPEPTSESSPETVTSLSPDQSRTLYEAIDAFLRSLEGKARSDSHKHAAAQVINRRLKKARKNCPLTEIDYLWLDQLCDYFKKRPALKKGGRMAPATVTHTLRYLRTFFTWLDDTEFGGWQGPRKLLKPFRVTERELMSPAELRQAATIRQFDLDTLCKLYKAASDRMRAWMLTALFTGATQQELAVLQKSEFGLDAGILEHFRNKTQVEGRYWLPPELVALLRAEFKGRPRDRLAFRTREGAALVTYRGDRKTSDAVRVAWNRLRDKAELPHALSFKYLRKFLADWMTRASGEAMGQLALSHSRNTVLAKNYTSARDFEGFMALQRKLYDELVSAGMFTPCGKTGERRAAAGQRDAA